MNKYQESLDNIGSTYFSMNYVANEKLRLEFEKMYNEYKQTLQELVDKATPIKLNRVICKTQISKYSTRIEHKAYCPICNTRILIKGNCCSNNDCRQALDWSD